MTDAEWEIFEPFLISRRGRRPRDHRKVLDAIFWIMRTGAPWRDLPTEFGDWNSIWRQLRRWANSGIWDTILEAFGGSAISDAALQMVDATIVRAHHCAAGGKGGRRETRLGARAAVSQPRSTLGPTPMDFPSAS
jgi:transposase